MLYYFLSFFLQQSVDQKTIQEQSSQIEELQLEKEQLKEQNVTLQSQVEFMQSSMVDKQLVIRLESKIRDLESRLELEQTTRHRAEVNTLNSCICFYYFRLYMCIS